MFTEIEDIPSYKLTEDFMFLRGYIDLCEIALRVGVSHFTGTDGEESSVQRRMDDSKSALSIINREIQRRIDNKTLPENGIEILNYATYRGLIEPDLFYSIPAGWRMVCAKESQTRLLWNICEECGIITGGGSSRQHQVNPLGYKAPDVTKFTSARSPEDEQTGLMIDLYGKE